MCVNPFGSARGLHKRFGLVGTLGKGAEVFTARKDGPVPWDVPAVPRRVADSSGAGKPATTVNHVPTALVSFSSPGLRQWTFCTNNCLDGKLCLC